LLTLHINNLYPIALAPHSVAIRIQTPHLADLGRVHHCLNDG
jgi:hypothetical protein